MLSSRNQPFPFASLDELLDAIAQARADGEVAGVHRIVLRRLRALGSDLGRAGRLARRGKPGGAYHAIAWQRVETIARAVLEIACLPQEARRRLFTAAARMLARPLEEATTEQPRR